MHQIAVKAVYQESQICNVSWYVSMVVHVRNTCDRFLHPTSRSMDVHAVEVASVEKGLLA